MVESAYIHIPFCISKCYYCTFISYAKPDLIPAYIDSLKKDIIENYKNEHLKTIYIGGGTPSLLSFHQFENILSLLKFNNKSEVTVEFNPDDASSDKFFQLFDIGVNRLSFGVQTFDDKILKLINRRHNSNEVFEVVNKSRKAGFKNISLDFIYGLPEQNLNGFLNDLKIAIDLNVEHISLYGLTIEKGCYFYDNTPQNLADDDLMADMYLGAVELLSKNGYEHYEISNFSKPGFYSKHNLNYWDNNEYYGFGAAAHGYVEGIRYGHLENLDMYISNPLAKNIERVETESDRLEEEIFLGFRKSSGIDIEKINRKFNIDFENKYYKILKKYSDLNLIKYSNGRYFMTDNGFLLSNSILADFIE